MRSNLSYLNRREALILLAGSTALAQVKFKDDPFTLGIASGEPWPDGFVLWTRLLPASGMPSGTIEVEWKVATDEKMSKVIRKGTAHAEPVWGHSLHVELKGLDPARWYWYQFTAGGVQSPVGRTRTAPPLGNAASLKFAFASCQNYTQGYYTAYRHMAEEDLDLVIHLGDYVYENGGPIDRVRPHPKEEMITLSQYRERYALYKSDPDLQAAHARFPWAVTWDDHEVDNNYAGMIPEETAPVTNFAERRAAAYHAYYEHMPLRSSAKPKGNDVLLYRSLPWGKLANIYILDTRQYRTDQPCGDGDKPNCPEVNNPNATMMGDKQQSWLFDGMSKSRANWNVIAQQVILADMDLDPGPGELHDMDKWDGYPAAREKLLGFIDDHKPTNPVVLAGDNHNHWVFDLRRDFNKPQTPVIGTEFAGTSITSGGDGDDINPSYAAVIPTIPHLKFHSGRRGLC